MAKCISVHGCAAMQCTAYCHCDASLPDDRSDTGGRGVEEEGGKRDDWEGGEGAIMSRKAIRMFRLNVLPAHVEDTINRSNV